jgi:pyruvate,water dikinase
MPPSGEPGVLTGVAASRGVVTGVARVILSPSDAGRLQPGEILVTRATDPGWTPAFSVIGGAVLEMGGLLSHGAIVAREYGLPAVVNVAGATRELRDGDRVEVDGTNGRVRRVGGRGSD